MAYVIEKLVIADSVLFNRTGMVRRWADGIERTFTAHAIAEAPIGSDTGRINKTSGLPVGALRASIHGDVDRIGPKQLQTTVSVDVFYAIYVLKGTSTIIARGEGGRFASAEEGMFIPGNPGWGRSQWRQRVRGQRANNFLDRAFAATARSHSSLRGYSMVGTL